MKTTQWLTDAAGNVSAVVSTAWGALPQGARDVLKGVGVGLVLGVWLTAAWLQ